MGRIEILQICIYIYIYVENMTDILGCISFTF